ncbi:MAG: hypothetical protein HYV95_05645 [Opitutae bacterium]|nr:hypothetical protein [Opitutae bacterium]
MHTLAPPAPATTEALRGIMRSFDFVAPAAARPLRPAVTVRASRRPARQATLKSKI